MKLNAITNYSLPSNKTNKNKNQSFKKAQVNVLYNIADSISGCSYDLKKPGILKDLTAKLVPVLEKFDDNLIFDVSATRRSRSFFDVFKEVIGLKVDIKYFDQKKAYYDILNKPQQEQLLKQETIQGLKEKNTYLLYMLAQKIGVGKFFRPKTETPDHYIETLSRMIKDDIIHMPNRLLENRNIKKNAEGKFVLVTDPSLWKGDDLRSTWAWYRGIEF